MHEIFLTLFFTFEKVNETDSLQLSGCNEPLVYQMNKRHQTYRHQKYVLKADESNFIYIETNLPPVFQFPKSNIYEDNDNWSRWRLFTKYSIFCGNIHVFSTIFVSNNGGN